MVVSLNAIAQREVVLTPAATQQDTQPEIILETPGLSVIRYRGVLRHPKFASIRARAGYHLLYLNQRGSTLVSDQGANRHILCPDQSLLFTRGPMDLSISFSRGAYEHYLLVWHTKQVLALTNWVEYVSTVRDRTKGSTFYVASAQTSPLQEVRNKLLKLSPVPNESSESLICGYIHEMVVHTLDAKDELLLAPIPPTLPSFLKDLLKKVKKNSAQSWSLKTAADLVGYSSFHLSRTFKTFMGYGFPEFVDRCRVESAIKHLSEGRHSVDKVSTICGYGSTHGLREAMKQHVGFLPSEIRSFHQLSHDMIEV